MPPKAGVFARLPLTFSDLCSFGGTPCLHFQPTVKTEVRHKYCYAFTNILGVISQKIMALKKSLSVSVCLEPMPRNAGVFARLRLVFNDLCSFILADDISIQILNLEKSVQRRIYS